MPTKKVETVDSGIDRSFLRRTTAEFAADFIDGLGEVIWNSIDWSGKALDSIITVRFFMKGSLQCIQVSDHGDGANKLGRSAIVSMGKSLARKMRNMKGRNGFGRLAFLHHALSCIYETKTVKSRLCRVEFDEKKLLDTWFGSGKMDWDLSELPPDHVVKTSGTSVTWVGLGEGEHVRSEHDRTPERVVQELAKRLLPNLARRIVVIDYDGQQYPLEQREIEGDPIRGEIHDAPIFKDMNWDLAIVAERQATVDRVMIGAYGPVCTVSEFLSRVRGNRDLLLRLRPLLSYPKLSGGIEIPYLNELTNPGRKSFRAELFDNRALVENILLAIFKLIATEIEQRLTTGSSDWMHSDDQTLISQLVEGIHQATGAKPEHREQIDIDENNANIKLEPGMSTTIRIRTARDDETYVWDIHHCGGQLDTARGAQVVYTAGDQLGRFTLYARRVGEDNDMPLKTVTINIVPELDFRLKRSFITLMSGERCQLTLDERALHHVQGEIVWDDSNCGGTLINPDGDRTKATYVAGEGKDQHFLIYVYDSADPDKRRDTCTIHIVSEREDRQKPEKVENEFTYNGYVFWLDFYRMEARGDALRHTSYFETGNPTLINLNMLHPLFLDKPDSVVLEAARFQIALCVAEAIIRMEERDDDTKQLAGMVYAELTHPQTVH